MAVSITSTLTLLDPADVVTNYVAHNISGAMGALGAVNLVDDDEAPPINGVDCLAWDCDVETGGYYYSFTTQDYSATHFWIWGLVTNAFVLENIVPASGQSGLYIIGVDGSGNVGYWHVGGADTYAGGWRCFVADLGSTPNTNNGTNPDMSDCVGLGLGVRCTGKSKATHNCYIDFLRVGNAGLKALTTLSSVAEWQDVFDGDDGIGIGVMRQSGLVSFAQGQLQFGDVSSGNIEFADTGQLVVFEDVPVSATLHEIKVVGNSGGTIKFQMGTKSGVRGISGCTLKGNIPFKFTATDVNIDELKLYGSLFHNAGNIALPVTAVGRELLDCVFEACGVVIASTCPITYCSFINSDAEALRLASTSHNVTICTFIGCAVGVQITAAGIYTFNNLKFAECTVDVENTALATQVTVYADTNQDTDVNLDGDPTAAGQTFTATAGVLSRARFWMKKTGTPAGNMVAKLYATSVGVPTGAALATSEDLAADSLAGTYGWADFEFWDEFTKSAATVYAIVVEYTGTGSDYVTLGVDNSSPGHAGTGYVYSGSWSSQTWDACFSVNRDGIVKINASNGADPSSTSNTGAVAGVVIIVNTVTLTITVKDEDRVAIENAQTSVRLFNSPYTELMNEDTLVTGIATEDYNYVGEVDVVVKVRKSEDTDDPRYVAFSKIDKITSTGLTLAVALKEQPLPI